VSPDLREFAGGALPGDAERRALQRREVGRDIVAAAYLRGDFVLTSGEHSDYYFDKYLFETRPTILRRLSEMLAERVPPGVDRLAGTEVGGVALAAAVSLATGLPFVIVRRQERSGGAPVRGELHASERVLLIQDVVDSGSQAIFAAHQITGLGASVAGVAAVIDRQAGGARNIADAGYHYDPLYTLSELDIEEERVNEHDVRKFLISGGVPADDLDAQPSNHVGSYSGLFDPPSAELLGRRLADALRPHRPTLVVVWEHIENSVLAHIVARELGVSALRVVDASGVLDYDGTFGISDRAVIVADAFRSDFPITAMRALTEQHGGQVAAFGAIMNTPALLAAAGEIAVTTLWPSAGEETTTS